MHRAAIGRQQIGDAPPRGRTIVLSAAAAVTSLRMNADRPTLPAAADAHGTLRLASYQKVERRKEDERRKEPLRAARGDRRTPIQRVMRSLFGT